MLTMWPGCLCGGDLAGFDLACGDLACALLLFAPVALCRRTMKARQQSELFISDIIEGSGFSLFRLRLRWIDLLHVQLIGWRLARMLNSWNAVRYMRYSYHLAKGWILAVSYSSIVILLCQGDTYRMYLG